MAGTAAQQPASGPARDTGGLRQRQRAAATPAAGHEGQPNGQPGADDDDDDDDEDEDGSAPKKEQKTFGRTPDGTGMHSHPTPPAHVACSACGPFYIAVPIKS